MNSKKFSILLALIALIVASLACGGPSEPTMSNVRMAQDQDGAQPTSTFGIFDTVYIVGDLAAVQVGNTVETRWFTENVDGYDPNFLIDSSSLTLETEDYDFFYFEFPAPPDGWPTGTYKVEVYFNGVLNTTVTYSVQ
jgi:hypothetical protein